ncbi:MAG: CRTAC1 family protein [Gemmataceae bacterium]|nr:CRTAC1 family protein [Gemmataceae bacterium]
MTRFLLGVVLVVGIAAGIFHATRGLVLTPPAQPSVASQPVANIPFFVDATAESKIDFRHFDSSTAAHATWETLGSGMAWIDFDQDELPDLFCIQDGPLKGGEGPSNKLFRNNGDGTFSDVTREVGLDRSGFGLGCAVGDIDNDGFPDLVVTYFRGVVLYRNVPDGKGGRKFVDASANSGLIDPQCATSCAFGDIDGDGLLDLYVCNYVKFDPEKYVPCYNKVFKENFVCGPTMFESVHHKLFRNLGNGRFEDVSETSGITNTPAAGGLGVVMADLDEDGLLDIYVANDMAPAYLFHNQGKGKFVEKAMPTGCALMGQGRYIAGMGVEAADFDGSGRLSLFVSNFHREPNMLFLNRGKLFFDEVSYRSGLGAPSVPRLAFGVVACDFDLDGRLDLAVANGHVIRNSDKILGDPFRQESQVFQGMGEGKYQDVSSKSGEYFSQKEVGRGLAWADWNNDGLPDLAFSNNAGLLALLKNATKTNSSWIRLTLEGDGKKSNRDAIGAKIVVEAGGQKQTRWLVGGGSYLSASDRRLVIGLGPAKSADRITVRWPSGRENVYQNLGGNCGYRLREGEPKELITK